MDRLTVLSGGFLFVLTQNLEEMEGLGPDSLFYSAKGVRISLGGNGTKPQLPMVNSQTAVYTPC
jgi:hypothetical protein